MSSATKKWTAKQVTDLREEVLARLNDLFPGAQHVERLAWLLEQIGGQTDDSSDLMLRQFVHIVLALELHAERAQLKSSDVKKLFDTATQILASMGIDRANSRLSFLHADLLRLSSKMSLDQGRIFEAIWNAELAKVFTYRPTDRQVSINALAAARAYRRSGLLSLALMSFDLALQEGEEAPFYYDVLIEIAATYRLSGAHDSARTAMAHLSNRPLDSRLEERFRWEALLLEIVGSESPELFFTALRKEFNTFQSLLTAKLWLFSAKTKGLTERLAKAESLRRRFKDEDEAVSENAALYKVVRLVEEAFETDFPLQSRMEKLGEALSLASTLPDLEQELLLRAAAVRWAQKFSQEPALHYLLSDYTAFCRKISGGLHDDTLFLVKDVKVYDSASLSEEERTLMVETSSFKRRLAVGRLWGKSAGIVVSNRVRRIIANEAERHRLKEEELKRLGETWYEALSEMKGGAMKIGQHLGFAPGIPAEFQTRLAQLHDEARPVNPSLSREVIERDFGKTIPELFKEFESTPVAVGSVGQVFRGVLHDGREVAVKVRHPGIVEAIRSDLGSMSLVKPILKQIIPKANVTELMAELKERIMSETDYVQEAVNQKLFEQNFADHQDVVIPKIVDELCSERVLTMEYLRGKSFSEFVASASDEEKSRAALILVRTFSEAFGIHGLFNGDPHPGNYLFLEDGRVAFLDFGCVKRFPDNLRNLFVELLRAAYTDDMEAGKRAWIELGYTRNSNNFDYAAQHAMLRQMTEPMLVDKTFRFDEEFVQMIQDFHLDRNPNLKEISPPRDAVILFRVAWGFISLVTALNAETNWHRLMESAMKKYDAHLGKRAS